MISNFFRLSKALDRAADAADILAVIADQVDSLPVLLEYIKTYSKLAGF